MWLALPATIVMQVFFTLGISLGIARVGAKSRDLGQLLPFFTRSWRYASGVFFSIAVFGDRLHGWAKSLLVYNPGAVYIDLVRDCLMRTHDAPLSVWVAGLLWAVGAFTWGLRFFHRGERNYV